MGFDDHVKATAPLFIQHAGGEPITYRPNGDPGQDRSISAIVVRDPPEADSGRPSGQDAIEVHVLVSSDPGVGIDAYAPDDEVLVARRKGDVAVETYRFHQFLGKDAGMWVLEFAL